MRDLAQRNAIVELALEKFRKYGIRRVTVDELARDLRISKKTLYLHFADKEALVQACVDRNLEQIFPRVSAALDSPGSAAERMAKMWQQFSVLPRIVTVELIADLKADYPHIWEEIDRKRRLLIGRIEALIVAGKEAGEIHPDIHPKVMMRILFAVLERVITPDVLTLGEFAPVDAVKTILTLFARGVFVTPPDMSATFERTDQ